MPDNYPYRFRTSVGGFHKGDVAAYISKAATAYKVKLSGLESQLQALQKENDALRQQIRDLELMTPAPQAPEAEAPQNVETRELAAYRRAEAAERLAYERAEKLYAQMDAICAESAAQVQQTESAVEEGITTLEAQFSTILTTMKGMNGRLSSALDQLHSMRMAVPDPAEGLEEL